MPKDTDQSQPTGSQPSGKASAEKIRADLHAAGLMRLLDTPPATLAKVIRHSGSNVIPFRRNGDQTPVRRRAPPVLADRKRANWKRPVATGFYMLLATAVAYLVGSGWSG